MRVNNFLFSNKIVNHNVRLRCQPSTDYEYKCAVCGVLYTKAKTTAQGPLTTTSRMQTHNNSHIASEQQPKRRRKKIVNKSDYENWNETLRFVVV